MAAGVYNLAVTLDKTKGAADGSWIGAAGGNATVQLQSEQASMSDEDMASKYLAMSAYAHFRGDLDGAGAALDTLIGLQRMCWRLTRAKPKCWRPGETMPMR